MSMRLLLAVFLNLSIDKEKYSHFTFLIYASDVSLEKCNDYRRFMALISSKVLGVRKQSLISISRSL